MNVAGFLMKLAHKLAWLGLAMILLHVGVSRGAAEQTFDVLKTRTGTYSNVTVTTKAKGYIFILHSTGMANIKISDLPDDVREQLGYVLPESSRQKIDKKISTVSTVAARELKTFNQKITPLKKSWQEKYHLGKEVPPLTPALVYTGLAILALLYLFNCYCCHLICIKAKQPASYLVWIPGLQFIPLLRAANMSGWWFLGSLVPGLNLVVFILWAFNITKAREKGILVAILLMLPLTNVFAFLYLAFSGSAAEEEDTKFKGKSIALQTA